jgi:hypothetical protein
MSDRVAVITDIHAASLLHPRKAAVGSLVLPSMQ